jgi:Cu(I)/Ag(I) efflux system protein CusF
MKHLTVTVMLAMTLAATSWAQQTADRTTPRAAPAKSEASLADGEVRSVDKAAKSITIRHGAIKTLDMPPMTMVYLVKDPVMLDRINIGDKVKFNAERTGSDYTVTELQSVK